ncbi:dynamin family protein [Neobacillus sedimentimangrovi]|uniref:dynamin family protein n=1 Tax=Neobacillus sedimentimangrovi TaxID=2699460 RepID=UPI0013CFF1BD|nr:dynamin family protein [Neobacillus sedimentimangrovi]
MAKTTVQQETVETLKQKLISFHEYYVEKEDFLSAEKVKQLAVKLRNREFSIAFCGHFSAGKSTMINRVIGENLLPSSPIPTSANLVTVKSGDEYAKVFFKHEKPRLYLAPYDYNLVKNYCKDGDAIESIEISHRHSKLPENTVIMDTPGIDSADDAHRIATESAIHLADIIFYVMDYNHVQAELNFLFTKELTEAGKEIYLIVNQIDKHNEEELSFFDFQKSVVESFASWGVSPSRIFYTSLKNPDHPFNEFQNLKSFIDDKLAVKDELIIPSMYHSLKKIAQDHLQQLNKKMEEKMDPLINILTELSEQEKEELEGTYQRLEGHINTFTEDGRNEEKEFDEGISQILKNAYLMPFETRALAEGYLEACQPEFKVGFLFAKKKTEEERMARLEKFYQDILDKTKTQVEWHIREFLLRTLKEQGLDQGDLLVLAQAYSIAVQKDVLINSVKPGARLSGEYLLHYTEDVANEIKKLARLELAEFRNRLLEAVKLQSVKLKQQYEKEYMKLEKYIKARSELQKYKDTLNAVESDINKLLNQTETYSVDPNNLFSKVEEEFEVIKPITVQESVLSTIDKKMVTNDIHPESDHLKNLVVKEGKAVENAEEHLKATVKKLQHVAKLIQDLPGFQKLANELVEKASRLENKGFTVALFGAFSAGKSSFANALIGEKVLPVSPNPTTAAINKIKPITADYQHGTVLVKFKERESMLEDINRSLKVFDLQAKDFAEAFKLIDQIFIEVGQEGVLEKTHYAFLKAFNKGYDTYVNRLGNVLQTNVTEFHEFVAKEERSCFVEWIELYYDCELTRKGITLVDTPGADSINARHTGVAFDYIKNSDAILFVTYYNHAFSKADREFLIQLGRVKESFQLDKMFFIINAIDLAENEEEKEAVVQYVTEQLVKYGIRKPHLYPLSSLNALKEKTIHNSDFNSGMSRFEKEFYYFINHDLTDVVITSAQKEINRVRELIDRLIHSAKEDQSVKEQKRMDIEKQRSTINQIFNNETVEPLKNHLLQEAEELIYYIKQRVFFRFNDFFKESFNPSILRVDGGNLKKALQSALEEFLESLGFDFAQEMRATTVRLERFIEKIMSDYQSTLVRKLKEINPDLSFSIYEKKKGKEIDFPIAFQNLDQHLFTKAKSYFNNPRSFFEKNEKKFMSDELNHVLNSPADNYLKKEGERMIHHFTEELSEEFNLLINQMKEQVNDFYLSLLATLDGGVSVEVLTKIQSEIGQ